jgi:hypothetical protein
MSTGKALVGAIGFWLAMGGSVRADAIASGLGQWTFWSQSTGTTTSLSSAVSPVVSSNPASPTPAPPTPASSTPVTTFSAPAPPPASPSMSSSTPDAFLNFGNGAYAEASLMTTGNIQTWYQSPSVTQAFGGTPTAQQQSDFANTVLNRVEQTFQLSGVPVNLSLDPNAGASHTLSVVSGASYSQNPDAIGITNIGGSGFSFIDKLGFAQSVDELAWADAHNIAHELMHAFGVSVHHDQTGQYLDAATANWSMLTSPSTKFSPEATQDILANLGHDHSNPALQAGAEMLGLPPLPHKLACHCLLCQRGYVLTGTPAAQLAAAPVPEPASVLGWALGAVACAGYLGRRRREAAESTSPKRSRAASSRRRREERG